MTLLWIVYVLNPCFTLQTYDVAYIEIYSTYLHGRCFLSTLYNDISCLTSPQSMLLFVSSDSGSHTYATSRSSSLCTDQRHTSSRNTACTVFAFAANTRNTAVVFLWKANAVNALIPVDLPGTQMDVVYPLKCLEDFFFFLYYAPWW
jgi:hypothetical protein